MSGEIKIEVDTLRDAVAKLNTSIGTFEGYVNHYVSDARKSLDGMHSNFIQELMKTLSNMNDDSNPKTLNEVKSFSAKIEAAVDAYVESDNDIAGQFAGN